MQPDADRKFVEDLFAKYGRILDISVKKTVSGTIFAFVEYHDPRDAQDAIRGTRPVIMLIDSFGRFLTHKDEYDFMDIFYASTLRRWD